MARASLDLIAGLAWDPEIERSLFVNESRVFVDILLFSQDVEGRSEPRPLEELGSNSWLNSASRDGRRLALVVPEEAGTGKIGIRVVDREGESVADLTFGGSFNEAEPHLSPDGRWVVYTSDRSGQLEVRVAELTEGGRRRQISSGGGSEPRWSPLGDELFYRDSTLMMRVAFDPEDESPFGTPEQLFEGNYLASRSPFDGTNYDVSPDGERFLMIQRMPDEESASRGYQHIIIIENWFEELKRLVPVEEASRN